MNVVVVLVALVVVIACARLVMRTTADQEAPDRTVIARPIEASPLPTTEPEPSDPLPTAEPPATILDVAPVAEVFVTPFQPGSVSTPHPHQPAAPIELAAPAPSAMDSSASGANPDRLIQTEILVSAGRTATVLSWARLVGGVTALGVVWGLGVVFGFRGLVVFFKNL